MLVPAFKPPEPAESSGENDKAVPAADTCSCSPPKEASLTPDKTDPNEITNPCTSPPDVIDSEPALWHKEICCSYFPVIIGCASDGTVSEREPPVFPKNSS